MGATKEGAIPGRPGVASGNGCDLGQVAGSQVVSVRQVGGSGNGRQSRKEVLVRSSQRKVKRQGRRRQDRFYQLAGCFSQGRFWQVEGWECIDNMFGCFSLGWHGVKNKHSGKGFLARPGAQTREL
eukprot:4210857-Heterocapsa_arctica.AAC.1